jgi:hypothetical protein
LSDAFLVCPFRFIKALQPRNHIDVSKSFKRLQAEKAAADALLREFTPVITVKDIEGLRGYLRDVKSKAEVSSTPHMAPLSNAQSLKRQPDFEE